MNVRSIQWGVQVTKYRPMISDWWHLWLPNEWPNLFSRYMYVCYIRYLDNIYLPIKLCYKHIFFSCGTKNHLIFLIGLLLSFYWILIYVLVLWWLTRHGFASWNHYVIEINHVPPPLRFPGWMHLSRIHSIFDTNFSLPIIILYTSFIFRIRASTYWFL